jgi:gamma-glutamyltranspeptidase/glutathione hydrolase
MSHGGVVVTAQQFAADAGAEALRAGGSAADGAVAAAFALCVVDPANCGVGGYGGYLVHAPPGVEPTTVEFNTAVPRRFPPERLRVPGETDPHRMVQGGAAVAPPTVVSGLLEAHARFGRLPLERLLAPAITLARDGFPVGRDLAATLARHIDGTGGSVGDAGIRARFFPGGRPLRAGERLVQDDLATTLEAVAQQGVDAVGRGAIAEAICETVAAAGGWLEPGDLVRDVVVRRPDSIEFGGARVWGPTLDESGAGVVFGALGEIRLDRLGANRSRAHIDEVVRALAVAWRGRVDAARARAAPAHTTTLASADADGVLVALTFTHGPTLGACLLVPGTGIVLNGGGNLFAPTPGGGGAITNMSPLIVEHGPVRHAFGATGGPRIPAILTTAVVDVIHYDFDLLEAIAAPHIAVRAMDGRPELEAPLGPLFGSDESATLASGDFGPASGVTLDGDRVTGAVDPRFERGLARARAT